MIKGPDIFVRIAKTIFSKVHGKKIFFVWVGGTASSEFARKVITSAHGENIKFVPHLENPYPYFNIFDIFLLPSRLEAFGIVSLEAAVLKKPTVCFASAGGIKEFVGYDCGFTVPGLDVDAMTGKVIELIESDILRSRLGENAYKKASSFYNGDIEIDKIINVIKNNLSCNERVK